MGWAIGPGLVDKRSTVATADESMAVTIGDDLISAPHFSNTKAIDLEAPAEDVYPWLAQMGLGRAGWYSYDWVDNFGRESATSLHAEWQVTAPGQPVPGGPIHFDTPIVDPPRALVLAVLARRIGPHTVDFTLAYSLAATPSGTRLVTRARGHIAGPGGAAFALYLLGPGDGLMVRRQLWGIAGRVDAATR